MSVRSYKQSHRNLYTYWLLFDLQGTVPSLIYYILGNDTMLHGINSCYLCY